MQILLLSVIFFALGLILTMRGGDQFVDAAARMAEASGVPRFVIGATLVSLCTTLPELTVSVLATLRGATDLAVGNAVGSAACNTGLILGVAALFAPARFSKKEARIKGGLMMTAAGLLACFAVDGTLQASEAGILSLILGIFLSVNLHGAARERQHTGRRRFEPGECTKTLGSFALGGAAVVLGAKLMVDHGVILARMLGIPESVIGLTLVALGTSLPELMTALAAIRRHEGTLSAGNIVGANLINLSMVLPACTAVSGGALPVGASVFTRDAPFTLVLMGIAMFPTMTCGRLKRWQGAALLLAYGVYVYGMA